MRCAVWLGSVALATACSGQTGSRAARNVTLPPVEKPPPPSDPGAPVAPAPPQAAPEAVGPEDALRARFDFLIDSARPGRFPAAPAHEWTGTDICARWMNKLVPAKVLALPDIADGGGAGFEARQLLEHCWPAQGGAWALVPRGFRRRSEYEVAGKLQLVFVSKHGQVVRGPELSYEGGNVNTTYFTAAPLSSGRPEERLALFSAQGFHNGGRRQGNAYALRQGRIVRLDLPSKIEDIVSAGDLDKDGNDDLFFDVPFAGSLCGCGCDEQTSLRGPWLVLHADAEGGYSATDAVAVEFARLQCPQAPDDNADAFGETSPIPIWEWVRCKRLWGASTEAIDAVLEKYCAANPNDQDMCAWCNMILGAWQTWAAATPPLVLF